MNCILCNGKGEIKHAKVQDLMFGGDRSWGMRICQKDNLMWVDEPVTEKELSTFYKNYPSHSTATNSSKVGFFQKVESYFIGFNMLAIISSQKPRTVLDFGCGNGDLLRALKELNLIVSGVEFEDSVLQNLKLEFGDNNIKNVKDILDFQHKSFDVIVLSHVIEHLLNPSEVLKSLNLLLKDKGTMIILTPNIESLGHKVFGSKWRGLEVPRHRFLFSVKSLEKILRNNSFTTQEVIFSSRMARGIFVSGLVPSFETMSSKPSWRYLIHFPGEIFAFFEGLLKVLGFGRLNEEMIFLAKKSNQS
ncbi:MAG: class I SAM-dependent methyltransferase [bacterium]|nr:class I SAM-dependent methyltransferase [bacterium]